MIYHGNRITPGGCRPDTGRGPHDSPITGSGFGADVVTPPTIA